MVGMSSSRISPLCLHKLEGVVELRFQCKSHRVLFFAADRGGFFGSVRKCSKLCPVSKNSFVLSSRSNRSLWPHSQHEQAGRLKVACSLIEGDVVEYVLPPEDGNAEGKQKNLGVVVSISASGPSTLCEVQPLCQEVPGSNEWLEDEDKSPDCVPLHRLQLVEEAWFSQRMVSDRVSNPHGEHAHNIWLIDSSRLNRE
ncbi:hypothetical protein MPTK1_1g17140 [Marchantia polymorpha subsp. ruderalis]|uniref:Uncharacterized protein n=2 Tax=Marchantia polymorpha TaxID=3197 RepID=A0AAF6AR40_MARPO|nr:hypothetical protein MARPO_0001s0054 [Marchantia polymorpha]BBM98910.1 hypothetical protein Mp_1g17140 [Marchantia polymorpha subsp. ruderalis]|eukprot:PTQ49986.1 hypothetical protein MARPO_0001s0054 [Marchantia polymorpha]